VEIITGIVMTVVVAVIFDVVLVLLGRVLMPWNRQQSKAARRLLVGT
jgi:osmoprotectant transport system permease protein